MPYLSLLGVGAMIFVSTDIDDLLLLVVLFSDRRLSARQVIVGQYIGFLGVVALSIGCALLATVIAPPWIGLLGIWPVLIGVQRLLHRARGDVIGETAEAAANSVGIPTVALLTLANGGDNLTVYAPLFATLTAGQITILVAEFLALIGVWCAVAKVMIAHPITRGVVRRIAHAILPYVLIGLGLWIVLRSGSVTILASHLPRFW